MSEKNCTHIVKSHSFNITELEQFEQLENENTKLNSLNQMYKEQLLCLEVEISDLKAVIMAKDYEIKLVQGKERSLALGKFSAGCKENSSNTGKETEIRQLKFLLEKEKTVNNQLSSRVQELEMIIKAMFEEHNPDLCRQKVERLEKAVERLTDLYGSEREVQSTPTFSNTEQTLSEVESTKQQFPDFSIDSDVDSSADTLVPSINTPHIFSSNLSKYQQPPIPQVHTRKLTPTSNPKSLTPCRIVRHFTCNLSEILSSSSSPPKAKHPAANFCPSVSRKMKVSISPTKSNN